MEYAGPERRSERPGRRGRDYETCVFHVEHTAKLKELETGTVPKWVFTWIGGGMAGMLLALSAWTAYQVTHVSERVARLETSIQTLIKQ